MKAVVWLRLSDRWSSAAAEGSAAWPEPEQEPRQA